MRSALLILGLLVIYATTLPAQETRLPTATPRAQIAGAAAQPSESLKKHSSQLPSEMVLTLKVDELPGIDNPRSFWEGAYEIRIADWEVIVEKTTSDNDQLLGDLLVNSSFSKRSFIDKSEREVRIALPVNGPLLQRLQHQAERPQGFLLRSTIRLFDARLDLTRAFDLNRIWQVKLFPDGEAIITIGLKPDGSYSTWGPIPKNLSPGYTIVGAPLKTTKKP